MRSHQVEGSWTSIPWYILIDAKHRLCSGIVNRQYGGMNVLLCTIDLLQQLQRFVDDGGISLESIVDLDFAVFNNVRRSHFNKLIKVAVVTVKLSSKRFRLRGVDDRYRIALHTRSINTLQSRG